MSTASLPGCDVAEPNPAPAAPEGPYVVVARRYRPKSFGELVGQQQVSQALSNAINTNRVGHAYLFTGARGVGKTSTARILAKCLNCVQGPSPEPCGQCDSCVCIAAGDDVDVLEIDGASNRGIDEIRQLRSNVNSRPSRSRSKIYIIDEVHMLTVQAFNALLKTLEEPPPHVKFIFCTTDPEKIPITVLSRCQRFDFAPVATESILDRLRFIVQTEQVEAEDAALQLLARRAAGSMRDSQSLLEQLLSFCGRRITEADVHAMLGTARGGCLAGIADELVARNAAGVLTQLDAAVAEGVDVGQLAEQLLGFFRDLMVAAVGGDVNLMLATTAADYPQVKASAQRFGLATILAAIQILDQAVARMRQSTQVRTLVEMALVRICALEDLAELSAVIAQVRDGAPIGTPGGPVGQTFLSARQTGMSAPPAAAPPAQPAAQKKNEPAIGRVTIPVGDTGGPPAPNPPALAEPSRQQPSSPPATPQESPPPATPEPDERAPVDLSQEPDALDVASLAVAEPPPPASSAVPALDLATAERHWQQALAEIGGMVAHFAGEYTAVAIPGPNLLVVSLRLAYNKEWCERPEVKRKLEQSISRLAGRDLRIEFAVTPSDETAVRTERPPPVASRMQRMREIEKHPLIRETLDLFDAEVLRYDEKQATP